VKLHALKSGASRKVFLFYNVPLTSPLKDGVCGSLAGQEQEEVSGKKKMKKIVFVRE